MLRASHLASALMLPSEHERPPRPCSRVSICWCLGRKSARRDWRLLRQGCSL